MKRFNLFLLFACAIAAIVFSSVCPAVADGPWAGTWKVTWPGRAFIVSFDQKGNTIVGRYHNGYGRVEGEADGQQIKGIIVNDGVLTTFSATISSDHQSFSGHTDSGSWLNGVRLTSAENHSQIKLDLHSPRAALRSFLDAANRARAGNSEAMDVAIGAVDFLDTPVGASHEGQLTSTERLFNAIDLGTFPLSLVPEAPDVDSVKVSLPRLDGNPSINLTMLLGADGNRRIAIPDEDTLRGIMGNAAPRPVDAFRLLQSPRDALRAFLNGMANWSSEGKEQAILALDLSGIPEVLQAEKGQISAQYLVRIIDRVGFIPLQSIPNSGANRQPFVFFRHPGGQIVIEPVGAGADTRWKFSADTVINANTLFRAVETLPAAHTLDAGTVPPSWLISVRESVQSVAPGLAQDAFGRGGMEYWQLLGCLLVLISIIVMTILFRRMLLWLLAHKSISPHFTNPNRVAMAVALGFAPAIGVQGLALLGIPSAARQYTLPVFGTLVICIVTYAAWHVISAVQSLLRSNAHKKQVDSMLLSFGGGVARLSLLTGAALAISQYWSIPTTGLIAGLGISGLAIAFASKETLANVFGAGILIADRPFRSGDRIIADGVDGWVEDVGLRSTRVRNLDSSLQIVPNGVLADTSISNLGAKAGRLFTTTLVITAGGTPEKLDNFTQAIVARISEDPDFEPDTTAANVTEIASDGVNIQISANFSKRTGTGHRDVVHKLLLDIMKIAKEGGLGLGTSVEAAAPAEARNAPVTAE